MIGERIQIIGHRFKRTGDFRMAKSKLPRLVIFGDLQREYVCEAIEEFADRTIINYSVSHSKPRNLFRRS